MSFLKVYEEGEVIEKLSKSSYLETFLARIKIKKIEFKQILWFDVEKANFSLLLSYIERYKSNPDVFLKDLYVGDEYVVTMCNVHHMDYLNPRILSINFNSTKNKLIEPWDYSQI